MNESKKDQNIFKEKLKNEERNTNQVKILVKIILKKGSWESSYNLETPLYKISNDFEIYNNMKSIQKNHFIEYIYKDNPINMDSTPLKFLINENATTLHIEYEIKPIPGTKIYEDYETINIVGKPFYNPFLIYTFEIKSKHIKVIKFNNLEEIKKIGLDKFGPDSSYCNGNNYLYISGGNDQSTNETIGKFWAIDLNKKLFNNPIDIIPKKNHSMIFVEKKVYIVGGEDLNTMYYDVNRKEIKHWAVLNNKRFEPSLIRHDNWLFCFDSSGKYIQNYENIFNFEKIDLFSESAEWEIVKPKISNNILNSGFTQKFFGVVEDFRNNIIFIGGIYDNYNKKQDININDYMNLQYNSYKNMIEKSDIEFKAINFSEKTFLPFNDKLYYNLPNFNKRFPKIVYFYKDRDLFDIIRYKKKVNNKYNNDNLELEDKENEKDDILDDKIYFNESKYTTINNNQMNDIINDEKKSEKEIIQNKIKNEDNIINIKDSTEAEVDKKEEEQLTIQKSDNIIKIISIKIPEKLVNYHSSLDNLFNNNIISYTVIKNIKLSKNKPPMNIDIKTLKKQILYMSKF